MRGATPRGQDRSVLLNTVIRDEPFPVRLDLDDFRGGWTCLAFFQPGMSSHPELASFERLRSAFAAEDCLLLAASIDPLWTLRDAPASFPLVADTNGLLAVSYGALAGGEPRFGWLLLDPSGRVRSGDLDQGPCAACALERLRALRGGRPRLRLAS
jgi:alkyl hydroperoxide reductase subunit AhpC